MCCKHWLPSQRKSYQVQWRIFSSLSGMSGTRKHHVNNNEQWTELWTDNTDKILHQITETESSQRCLTRRYFVSLKISSNTYFCYLNDPHISNEKWCVRLTIKYIMTVSVVMRERLRHKGPTPPPPVLGQSSERRSLSSQVSLRGHQGHRHVSVTPQAKVLGSFSVATLACVLLTGMEPLPAVRPLYSLCTSVQPLTGRLSGDISHVTSILVTKSRGYWLGKAVTDIIYFN